MAEQPSTAKVGDEPRAAVVIAAIAALIGLRLIAAAVIDLGADESYYFLWSLHPGWGYYDHPPMVAWWIAAGTALFGENPFGIRFLFVLSAIPTTLATFLAGSLLLGRATGLLAALWINATLLVGVGGISATPDAPAVMLWSLAIAAFVLAIVRGRGQWWLAVGVFSGLGVLSKLTNLFLGLGILLCLAVRRDLRRVLLGPWPWLGGLVALFVVAPLLWWNAGHDWLTFGRQFGRLRPGELNPLRFLEFIGTQFALLNPLIALFVGLAAATWVRSERGSSAGLLFWTAIPLAAYMAFHSLHGQVQAHWLAPIYPTLVVAAAAAALATSDARWNALRRLAFPVGVAASLIGLFLAANPAGVLPPAIDPGKMNHGWRALAEEADGLREASGATWIATANYADTAAIAYALRDSGTPVVPVADRARFVFAPMPDDALLRQPALLVAREGSSERIAACFAVAEPVGTIERRSGTAVIERLVALRVEGAAADLFASGCD